MSIKKKDLSVPFKRQCREIFGLLFIHRTVPTWPLIDAFKLFEFSYEFAKILTKMCGPPLYRTALDYGSALPVCRIALDRSLQSKISAIRIRKHLVYIAGAQGLYRWAKKPRVENIATLPYLLKSFNCK
jgi:hypothetical protein